MNQADVRLSKPVNQDYLDEADKRIPNLRYIIYVLPWF